MREHSIFCEGHMKLTTEVEIEVTAKAVLRGDALSVSVSAAAPYADGKRSATASIEVLALEEVAPVRDALQKLLDAKVKDVARRAQRAALEAESIAARAGE